MKTYKFDEKKVEQFKIDINGVKFEFNPQTLEVQEAIRDFNSRLNPIIAKLDSKDITEQELYELTYRACIVTKETINKILGKRAYERIFKNRSADYLENMNLMRFFFKEIKEFSNEHSNGSTANVN